MKLKNFLDLWASWGRETTQGWESESKTEVFQPCNEKVKQTFLKTGSDSKRLTSPNSAPSPSPDTRQRNKNWGLCTQRSSVEPFITYIPGKLKYGTRWSEIIITTAPAAEHRQIHLQQQQIKPVFYETGLEYKIKQQFLFEDKCKTRASSLERSSSEMFLQCSPEQRFSAFVRVPGEPEPARAGVPQMFESAAKH